MSYGWNNNACRIYLHPYFTTKKKLIQQLFTKNKMANKYMMDDGREVKRDFDKTARKNLRLKLLKIL
jgi:hypothetical protein